MQQQDPLEPTKTADLLSQVSQIRSIELSGQLTDTLDLMAKQQRILGVSDMIGKYISASITGPDGSPTEVSGVVTGISYNTDGSTILELDTGAAVPAQAVQRVTTLDVHELELAAGGQASDPPPESQNKADNAAKARNAPSQNWLSLNGALRL
jgi:flagellar hook assembly protein FlgD